MRIVMFSYKYAPGLGGMETIAAVLVREWLRQGHSVTVITHQPGDDDVAVTDAPTPRVLRRPSVATMLREARAADVIIHNHLWLRTASVAVLARRPWAVAVHSWLGVEHSRRERLKLASLRLSKVIAVSGALAYHVRHASPTVVPNCYDSDVFHDRYDVRREDDAVFLGRLVEEKGADLAIAAVGAVDGLTLTVIGDGPARPALLAQAERAGVADRVRFAGVLQGTALAAELNRHSLMLVPSRWGEPFGVVALEGIACGCVVVASNGGGLAEAVGRCGITFANNDLPGLIAAIRSARAPDAHRRLRAAAPSHLAAHAPDLVAQKYLDVALGRT